MALLTNINGKFSVDTDGAASFNRIGASTTTGFTFPSADGANGEVLKTNGSGTVSWLPDSSPTVYWAANGNDIYNTNSANVGIGTNSPVNKLEAKGLFAAPLTTGSAQNGIARFSQTSGVGSLDIGFGDPYSWLQSRSSSSYATNYNLALQPNGGNVGIGTSLPAVNLQVESAAGPGIAFSNSGTPSSGSSRGDLAWFNSAVSTTALIRSGAVTDNVGSDLQFFTRPAGGSLIESMRIRSTGSLLGSHESVAGIATGLQLMNPINAAGTGHGTSILLHCTNGDPNRGVKIASSSTSNYATDNDMLFYTSAGSTLTERMRITSAGDVGISNGGSFSVGSATSEAKTQTEHTGSVDSSGKIILTTISDGMSSASAAKVTVYGDNNSNAGFYDEILVMANNSASPQVLVARNTNNAATAPTRTYTVVSNQLKLVMGSGSFSVNVKSEAMGLPF